MDDSIRKPKSGDSWPNLKRSIVGKISIFSISHVSGIKVEGEEIKIGCKRRIGFKLTLAAHAEEEPVEAVVAMTFYPRCFALGPEAEEEENSEKSRW